ncbi:MAG: hypothetical protein PHC60_02710 [Heliobacteriaceae bacterium]|nr:hypothetical protein [Heliobacteriaceae bacterium]MDD4587292.1 hypothetical protein [Heliobacteriaceae bacterium]
MVRRRRTGQLMTRSLNVNPARIRSEAQTKPEETASGTSLTGEPDSPLVTGCRPTWGFYPGE